MRYFLSINCQNLANALAVITWAAAYLFVEQTRETHKETTLYGAKRIPEIAAAVHANGGKVIKRKKDLRDDDSKILSLSILQLFLRSK